MLLVFSQMLVFSQIVSDSSLPHGLQHTRLPCLSPFPGVHPSSCPLNQWCHPSHPLSSLESSVHFSCSVVSDSLWPHEPQHTRPPCPPPTPGVYTNSCPLSHWCHPTISSSVIHFSSLPQSFPNQDLFKWVSSLHQVAKVLEFQLQHQSFQWTPRTDLGDSI